MLEGSVGGGGLIRVKSEGTEGCSSKKKGRKRRDYCPCRSVCVGVGVGECGRGRGSRVVNSSSMCMKKEEGLST